MTEEEALIKWCPHSISRAITIECRDGSTDIARWNNEYGNLSTLCIASDCMMWKKNENSPPLPNGDIPLAADGGHCGLAK